MAPGVARKQEICRIVYVDVSLGEMDVLPENVLGWRIESVPVRRRTMRRSRYKEDQIIGMLKERQAGLSAQELCRK